ncbi:unnamed protein product, partial [Ilex paraguariensis]
MENSRVYGNQFKNCNSLLNVIKPTTRNRLDSRQFEALSKSANDITVAPLPSMSSGTMH